MLRSAVFAGTALSLALAPIAAQAAQPTVARTDAGIEDSEQLRGTTMWIVAAIALGLIIWGIMELTGDDEPESP